MTRVAACEPGFCAQPVLCAELCERYPDSTLNREGRRLRGRDLIDFLRGHDAAIVGAEPVDGALLDAVPEIRVVSKWGVGINTVEVPALTARGIRLGFTPGVNRLSVAELTLGLTIAALRRLPAATQETRAGIWRRHIGRQLTGKTVGVIGCGHIGKEYVRLLAPFHCRILVNDIRAYPEFFAAHGIEAVGLDDLLAQADVVSLHLPLDDATRGLIAAARLALMKPEAVLVNTARGGIVDESSLYDALARGRLAGAAFDVFSCEPPENIDLLKLPNVMATPHIGASAHEAILAMGRAAIDGITEAKVP